MAVTIKDIARVAGVSYGTVSRALNDSPRVKPETRIRIQRLAQEMGYEPSALGRGLATRRSKSLGVAVLDITDPFIAELVRAIDRVALDHGYSLILSHCGGDPERELAAIRLLRQRRADAIIVPDPRVADSLLLREPGDAPVVLINRRTYQYSVSTDNQAAARDAVRHLLSLGHTRIAYIGSCLNLTENPERLAGYQQALAEAGLAPPAEYLVEADGWPEGGQRAMRRLLALPHPPSAVFCFNDLTALGAIEAVRSAGLRVPDDLSVAGFDDIYLARYSSPPLTTVAQQSDRMARLAVEMALALIEGTPLPTDTTLPGRLVVRQSTAPPRAEL